MKTFNSIALGYAAALVSAAGMLLLGILGNLGFYEGAVAMMAEWHVFFSLSLGGIVGGMIEVALISFAFLYTFGIVYNWLTTRNRK